MMSLKDYLNRSCSTYEMEVYELLLKCAKEGEHITHKIEPSTRVEFDFYLPQGLGNLEWPEDTFVEVKYRMSSQSFNIIRRGYDVFHCALLVVIVFEEDSIPNDLLDSNLIRGRNVEFWPFKKFKDEIGKVCSLEKVVDDKKNEILSPYEKLSECFKRKERFSLFVGAGVSSSAGVPTWDKLLEELCIKKGINKIDSDIESVVKGRFILEEYRDNKSRIPDVFYNDMHDILYKNVRDSQLIRSIAQIVQNSNVESIITYNYDNLLEREINSGPKKCDSIYEKTRTFNIPVYHVHGYISQDDVNDRCEIILGEKEYHRIYEDMCNWSNIEQLHALNGNICLFLGLSMKDPNLRRLIDISTEDTEIEPIHYAFLRRIECNVPFMESIMRGFGVNCIWYENYDELPKMLKCLVE